MKNRFLFPVIAAVTIIAAFSCSKEIEPEVLSEDNTSAEQPSTVFTYSVSIDASKGVDSKALTLEGNTLNATWAIGEAVTAYNETKGEALTGTLIAQRSGASTTLEGELSGSKGIAVGDELTLKFLSPNYSNQDGTLEYIAANCDYATASVSVTGVSGSDIRTGTASFVNQQAIVHFELVHPNGYWGLYTSEVKIVVNNQLITVNLATEAKDIYVAVPGILMKKVVIGASFNEDGKDYYYIKPSASFNSGKYYSIPVTMKEGVVVFNETELTSAISANSPYIVLGCSIQPSACILIDGSRNITLDLCGNALNRNLTAPPSGDGHVIGIRSGSSLTINDSSADNLGCICGGWAANGGGIYINSGSTVTLNGGYVSHNYATTNGGGIYNAGTLNIGSTAKAAWVTNNHCKGEGGGIYDKGTINMQGIVHVHDNDNVTAGSLDSNLCLGSGKVINVTGTMESNSKIRVYCENYIEQVITSGYHAATDHISCQYFQTDVGGFTLWYENEELLFQQRAYGTPIRYLDRGWDEGTGKVVETLRFNFAENIFSVLEGDGITDLDGYYYVTGDVTTSDKLYATGTVHLILCDGASLTANCIVNDDNEVHIYGQLAGTGQFKATDPDSGYPGIGSHAKYGKGVYISGGVITVEGASNCAGIGGGYTIVDNYYNYWACTSISIYGGTVNATGGSEAAGIGGAGSSPHFNYIYIYGGTVNAQGGSSPAFSSDGGGAGIGGGDYCRYGGEIQIKGGTVNATGGSEAAGIGVGQNDDNTTPWMTHVYISGGTVTATGGARGAGIGGGDGVSGCSVYVSGGTVKAYGGTDAAGIGSGEAAGDNNEGSSIEISGGFVEAWGSGNGSGLGAGEDSALGRITITGGTTIAHGSSDGLAICNHINTGTNEVSIGKKMRLRISDNILSYTERELNRLRTYQDIQIEPCPHNGSVCSWCMYGH